MVRIFVGSSREAIDYVDAIQTALSYEAEVTPWHAGVFNGQKYPMEDLEKQLYTNDFAVFVFSPDDLVQMRGKSYFVVRDNTLFEMGLFWGRLSRDRVFFLIPDKLKENHVEGVEGYHLASDLAGLTVLTYQNNRKDDNFGAAVNSACSMIKKQLHKQKFFENPEITVSTLRSVVNFYRNFNHNIFNRPADHFESLIDAVRNSYNTECINFRIKGAALWKGNSNSIDQVTGNVGKGKSYNITINENLEPGQPKILVVEAYLKSCIEFIDISVGLVKEYLLCYPLGKNHVLSIHITGFKNVDDTEIEILYSANQGLIGTINSLFGGDWS